MLEIKNDVPIMAQLDKEQVKQVLKEQVNTSSLKKAILNPYDGTVTIEAIGKNVRFGSTLCSASNFKEEDIMEAYNKLSKEVYAHIISGSGNMEPLPSIIGGEYPITILSSQKRTEYKMLNTKLRVYNINIQDDFKEYIESVIKNEVLKSN